MFSGCIKTKQQFRDILLEVIEKPIKLSRLKWLNLTKKKSDSFVKFY